LQVAQYGFQHTVGARVGPCQPVKDSVRKALGAPYRRYFSDEENTDTGEQVFWHEWGYRIRTSAGEPAADSVNVVGFRWGHRVAGCEVLERRARVPGPGGIPWEQAGTVPVG
jgi:hypothetical protein